MRGPSFAAAPRPSGLQHSHEYTFGWLTIGY
jgi:hypothetical protein